MSSNREILTFQFGHYANYVGSHWWNFQVSGSTRLNPSLNYLKFTLFDDCRRIVLNMTPAPLKIRIPLPMKLTTMSSIAKDLIKM